jgi:hypothetical protein
MVMHVHNFFDSDRLIPRLLCNDQENS